MQPKLPTPEADQLLAELLEIMTLSTPLNWESARFAVQSTVLTDTSTASAVRKDGTRKSYAMPDVFSKKLDQFRAACYEPGRGTWYSAAITLRDGAEPDVQLYYDEKPEWPLDAWPHPYSYVRDLEFFPRDDEHMPDWLREQVELAATAETEGWQGEG
ncbi:hypothetical protein SK803_35940 [Lentzea sp. BCCO 10_0856]|uniref:Uncharacterized protein n=1 Tax=Lentzea miocenica TaxID=3095431 RepID=A0ABU4TBS0_9PSEU|nr:hypothetical protein [Lentzea sp. BCCO 10_0856]MDX8035624.1 hypothetical protein [Lentzea sp. BCCO 10_0856]